MRQHSVIPSEAVEVAARASWEMANSDPWISGDHDDERWADRRVYMDDARVMLEAAATPLLAEAWRDGCAEGLASRWEAGVTRLPTNPYMIQHKVASDADFGERADESLTLSNEPLAEAFDAGFTACAHEHMKQDKDPSHPITRTNPYRSRA